MQFFDFGDEDGSGALDMLEVKHIMTSAGHSQQHLEAALQALAASSMLPWELHTDPDSGNDFYFNRDTNEKSWDPPVNFLGQSDVGKDGDHTAGEGSDGVTQLSKVEFVAFVKSIKEEDTSIAAEIDYIYEQIWYLKELRVEHDANESKWGSALDKLFELMDTDDSGSVGMDAAKKIFLAAGCSAEHLRLAAAMAMEKTGANAGGDAGGDASLDKAAFVAFGKTTNEAGDTIENFIASLYFAVAKMIMTDFKDVSTDGGGEQKGDAGEHDVLHVVVDTRVRRVHVLAMVVWPFEDTCI